MSGIRHELTPTRKCIRAHDNGKKRTRNWMLLFSSIMDDSITCRGILIRIVYYDDDRSRGRGLRHQAAADRDQCEGTRLNGQDPEDGQEQEEQASVSALHELTEAICALKIGWVRGDVIHKAGI